ncbi:type 2 isopentenyl-diphosphate Delta-isomerase [Leuconostocaceae bacterium ESL0958]|nr:type 2 isopentenyl-diphosphate Delta-isomerase [Leuconostocaceae bacterium ESL0958]
MANLQSQRKNEHLSLATKFWRDGSNQQVGPGFEAVRLIPGPLTDMSVAEADPSLLLFGQHFDWPFYIEAMTGGSAQGKAVNEALAKVAAETNLAMAVGSQSAALKDPTLADSYQVVRKQHPTGFLIANLGADHPIDHVRAAVDMIEANAIELHVNLGQELSMAEGDRAFFWLENLNNVIAKAPVPVIIKEVGFGMGPALLQQLAALEPAAINIGGGNGTSFHQIEQRRDRQKTAPLDLTQYGLSTVESLLAAEKANLTTPVIATGGIQSINDVLTALVLGAKTSSVAGYFLKVLMTDGPNALTQEILSWQAALPKLMTLCGAQTLADLPQQDRIYSPALQNSFDQL